MSLRGSCGFQVLPWIFWCHGRWMFFSEGQSGNTSALLPKPYYELGGFRLGRRGGLRRRFELEIVRCYTWWTPCLPVLGAFGRVCHEPLSCGTCCFLYLLSDTWNHWDLWSAPQHFPYFPCPSLTSISSDPLHSFSCRDKAGTRESSPTCLSLPWSEAKAVHYLILTWFNSSQLRFQQVFLDL